MRKTLEFHNKISDHQRDYCKQIIIKHYNLKFTRYIDYINLRITSKVYQHWLDNANVILKTIYLLNNMGKDMTRNLCLYFRSPWLY